MKPEELDGMACTTLLSSVNVFSVSSRSDKQHNMMVMEGCEGIIESFPANKEHTLSLSLWHIHCVMFSSPPFTKSRRKERGKIFDILCVEGKKLALGSVLERISRLLFLSFLFILPCHSTADKRRSHLSCDSKHRFGSH